MRAEIPIPMLLCSLIVMATGCGSTVVKYGSDPDLTVEIQPDEVDPLTPDTPVIPDEYRYRIKLMHDTSEPLYIETGKSDLIRAWVIDFETNAPAPNFPVVFEVLSSTPECGPDASACGEFQVKESLTDKSGNVVVTFEAGEQGEVLYDVRVSGKEAMPDTMQIQVADPPTGDLRVKLQYYGPVPIHNINVRLMHGMFSCADFNPVNPWADIDQNKTVSGIDSSPVFKGVPVEETWLVFATALGPTDHLTAEGCNDAIHVVPIENGETVVTLELDPVILNPSGTYDMVSRFDFTGAIPGQAGEIVDMVVKLVEDPGDIIIDLIKELVASYIGSLATEAVFGLFEDMLSDIISDWLLNNSPDFIQDLFFVGQDLIQIVHHVELTSELKLSKMSGDFYFQGSQSWQGINLYWKLNCNPESPDYDECGKYPFSLQDLQNTDVPIDLIEGQFTGMIANYDQLIIDKHIIELNYGKLILFAINEMLLPAVSEFNSIEALLYSVIDCPSIAEAFDNAILEGLGIDEDDLVGFCNQAVGMLIDPIEEVINGLALDSKLRIHGKCTMLDEDDDLFVDKLLDGLWWGHIEIQSEEGAEFEGTFEAEKAEMP